MKYLYTLPLFLLAFCLRAQEQQLVIGNDFEGEAILTDWQGGDCAVNMGVPNPFRRGINSSKTVLEYHDTGGQYANLRFALGNDPKWTGARKFALKVFVPASGLTGSQPNQVSLKLQDGRLGQPWMTQSEIVKPIVLDQWQEVTFDFATDEVVNLSPTALPPTERTDFNQVIIQFNGENNTDHVLAYLDDVRLEEVTPSVPVYSELVWADEFDGQGAIDEDKWFHQTQLPASGSWFNGEVQHYTDRTENAVVEDGVLKIIARKEKYTDQGHTKAYTSARLNAKFAFTYGRVEIRAKLPAGVGVWPALWMLGRNINEDGGYWDQRGFGTDPWPACGEVDIMEHWGRNANYVQSTLHTPSSFGKSENHGGRTIPTATTDFHVYAVEWTPEKMVFSVDSVIHYTYQPEVQDANTWPYDHDHYLLFNVAVLPTISPDFEAAALEIDYVRIYQESPPAEPADVSGKVYPQTVTDTLSLELEQSDLPALRLRLYDAEDELVEVRESQLYYKMILPELGELAPGNYRIEFELEGEAYRLEFVKE